jgi:hypothetical protein
MVREHLSHSFGEQMWRGVSASTPRARSVSRGGGGARGVLTNTLCAQLASRGGGDGGGACGASTALVGERRG